MKYLGIDFGTKSIGISISNEEGTIAFPREEIANMRGAIGAITKLVADEGVHAVIVGNTRALNGQPNTITGSAERFIDQLKERGLNVVVVSEAWSTQEAARFAPQGKKHSDSAAAAIILQRFLDTNK